MKSKVIDINTIADDGMTYTTVEQDGCTGCELRNQPGCLATCCSASTRPDHRNVIWKKVPDKQIHVSLSKIKQTKTYKLNFQP